MSLKQEIETWVEALAHYDNNEFEEALKTFDAIADTSKILFNCGVIHATLGQHGKAVEYYQRAIGLDRYLAVAYFQQGVSNFLIGDFEEALVNFNDALRYLRNNPYIDYEQLGLKFKLYCCEVLFNRGLCYVYLQQKEEGMKDLSYAVKEKMVEDHNVIDEAIQEEAEGYTVFSIPVGVVYRPNSAKVKNLKTKDYLGKARLVAATTRNNTFTGFAGAELKKTTQPGMVKDDRPPDSLSFAASNLVKPGLRSRTRQQSEPPLNRQVFPPTPPPESDRPSLFRHSNELDQAFPSNRNNPTNSTELERTSSNRIAPVGTESERPTLSRMNTSITIHESERGPSSSRSNISASKDSEWTSPSPLSSRTTLTAGNEVGKPPPLSRAKSDNNAVGASSLMMNERALSIRGSKNRPESLETIKTQTQVQAPEEVREKPRPPLIRTASEPRGPSRSYSTNRGSGGNGHEYSRPRMMSRERLRRPEEEPIVLEDERSPEGGIYDMYRNHTHLKSFSGRRAASRGPRAQPEFIEEEEEELAVGGRRGSSRGSSNSEVGEAEEQEGGGGEDNLSIDSRDFEMISSLNNHHGGARRPSTTTTTRTSRNPIRKVRIKVHVHSDTRYILFTNNNDNNTTLSIRYSEVIDRITDKFGLHHHRFRCTVLDDGDQITLGDQDDLDMVLSTAKTAARREGADMAKMEVWVVDASR